MSAKQDLIEHAIMEMLGDKDFDGYILTRLDCKVVDEIPGAPVQTAALIFRGSRFFIRIAHEFFKNLTDAERVAVLKHEIAHFINKHMSRRNGRDPMIWNIVGDMAINQNIVNLPKDCVPLQKGWPTHESTELYYDKYMKELVKQSKQGQGQGQSQGQSQGQGQQGGQQPGSLPSKQWDTVMDAPVEEGSSADSLADEILRETIKERLNAGDSMEKLRGLHAGALQELIDDLTKPPMIDWKQALTRFAASLADVQTRLTLKRPDRRQLSPFGKRKEYFPSLVVCVDTSGSVSDELLSRFFSQIKLLGRMLSEVQVVIADAAVHESFEYRSGLEAKLAKSGFGRGGTDFDPAVQYINKNLSQHDGAVYLTDGYCPVPATKCRIPMIWIVTDNESFEGKPKIMAPDEGDHRRRRY
ncbi:hypothetical protein KKH23_04415 [Patescibacteria group bacterium]|nr:hypothetical protein [Patescibacteria group bacterium]